VDLSTADSNKWLTLLKASLEGQNPGSCTTSDYQLVASIRQRQRRLTEARVAEMAEKYQGGATIYELAAEFGCHRTTVSGRLKDAGVAIRGRPPTAETVDSMVRLYASGISLTDVGVQLGFSANSVRNNLLSLGIRARDTHGRVR
jgi:hypothetical protein